MNIILCGLPGCGKTSVGLILSKKLNMGYIDTDKEVENLFEFQEKSSLSCREIYQKRGFRIFRKLEKQEICHLIGIKNIVISLGGGTLRDATVRNLVAPLGLFIYLKAPDDFLFNELLKKGLPAYLDKDDPKGSFQKLSRLRKPDYE